MADGFYVMEDGPEFRGDDIESRPWWPIWWGLGSSGGDRMGTAHKSGDRWFMDMGNDESGNPLTLGRPAPQKD